MSTSQLERPTAPVGDVPRQRPRWALFRRKATPYGFLTPTVVLMLILMITPIIMVVGYSLLSGVITNKNPVFVGLDNYLDVIKNPAGIKIV